jgi:predicted RNA-binding protein with EMAP domain
MTEIEKAREVIKECREAVNTGESAMIEGVAKHRLVDKLQEIVELKEERLEIVEGEKEFDLDRLNQINEEQEKLLETLKQHGVPYHPVMCSKKTWEEIQVDQRPEVTA